MKYPEFKAVYLEGLMADKNLDKIRVSAALKGNIRPLNPRTGLDSKTTAAIQAQVAAAESEDIRKLWNLVYEDIKVIDANYNGRAHYSPSERGIYFNLKEDTGTSDQKPYRKFFRETGHLTDSWLEKYSGWRSATFKNGLFIKSLQTEAAAYIKAQKIVLGVESDEEVYVHLSGKLMALELAEQHEISDIWHGASNKKVHGFYGHNKKNYWEENGGENLAKETFAHMFCITIQNPQAVNHIRNYFPKSYEIFLE